MSGAGATILAATDKAVALIDHFAACFSNCRDQASMEHTAATLVRQRANAAQPNKYNSPVSAHREKGRLVLLSPGLDPILCALLGLGDLI